MKILMCPLGVFASNVNSNVYRIVGMSSQAERGYVAVSEVDADELLKREGYELVDISKYKGAPANLPVGLKELVEKHSESIAKETPTQEIQVSLEDEDDINESTLPTDLIPNPCIWCRFKHWVQNKFRRDSKT